MIRVCHLLEVNSLDDICGCWALRLVFPLTMKTTSSQNLHECLLCLEYRSRQKNATEDFKDATISWQKQPLGQYSFTDHDLGKIFRDFSRCSGNGADGPGNLFAKCHNVVFLWSTINLNNILKLNGIIFTMHGFEFRRVDTGEIGPYCRQRGGCFSSLLQSPRSVRMARTGHPFLLGDVFSLPIASIHSILP